MMMTSADDRLLLVAELQAIRSLATNSFMSTAGLGECRRRLRHPEMRCAVLTHSVTGLWSSVLDQVCRALAGDDAGRLAYYVGVGDLLLTAPDDARGLGEPS